VIEGWRWRKSEMLGSMLSAAGERAEGAAG
jgi:hypothetical protein